MKTLTAVSALVVVAIGATLSCASRQNAPRTGNDTDQAQPADMEPASRTVPAANACADENGEPRKCSINAECCPGTSCGFDPGLSRVQRYCLQ